MEYFPAPPLVKFSKKTYLKELQNGFMYMGNASYYRELEDRDGNIVQGDSLETRIPYDGEFFKKIHSENNIQPEDIKEGYMISANTFICCMYAFNKSNILKQGDNWITMGIRNNREALKKLDGDHALVIYDAPSLIQSFQLTSFDCKYKQSGYVTYQDLNNQSIANSIVETYINYLASKDPFKKIQRPEFIKDKEYMYQQEYRFLINTGFSGEDLVNELQGVRKNNSIKIEIENSTGYSFICSKDDILNGTLLFKWEDGLLKVGLGD